MDSSSATTHPPTSTTVTTAVTSVTVTQNTTAEPASTSVEVPNETADQKSEKSETVTDSPDSKAVSQSGKSAEGGADGEKPAETATVCAENESERCQPDTSKTNSPSNLYPSLAEHELEQPAGQESVKGKKAADTLTENPSVEEMDSDASFVVLEKSSTTESVLDGQSGDLGGEISKDTASAGHSPPVVEVPGSKGDPAKATAPQKVDDAAASAGASPAVASASLAEPESSGSKDASKSRPETLQMAEGSEAGGSGAGAESGGATGGAKGGGGRGESVYYVKWILFNSSKVPIITQNENGPCPLLAIMNVLLMKGKVRLAPLVEMITSEQLMAHLGDCVVESKPKNLDEAHRVNYEQNMQDAMNLMYKLQTGLDVNVRFTGVSDFEYTSECIIFDLLELGLYHGWLVDPQDQENVGAVGKCSYNQLVEKVIQHKNSPNDRQVQEALIAEQFLDSTASQLTYHGLCELSSTVKEKELCVFFRNNHFNTMYRHNNELFLLVTDQGFLTESSVVWETLSNVDGDCHFVDANFCTYTKPPPPTQPIPTSPYFSGDEQINSDYQVALSLQHQDEQMMVEQAAAWGQFHNEFGAAQTSDHELALRLQEEEDRRAAAALQEQRAQQGQGQATATQGQGQAVASGGGSGGGSSNDRRPPREREDRRDKKDGKDCCIL